MQCRQSRGDCEVQCYLMTGVDVCSEVECDALPLVCALYRLKDSKQCLPSHWHSTNYFKVPKSTS